MSSMFDHPEYDPEFAEEFDEQDEEVDSPWNASHGLYHGPTADQLRQAKEALEREECSSVTLFFSLDERDEDGGLMHATSLTIGKFGFWFFEGTQRCKNYAHPDGGQSPVRGEWDPVDKTGAMEFQIPSPPVSA